jgi:hypothetical protein
MTWINCKSLSGNKNYSFQAGKCLYQLFQNFSPSTLPRLTAAALLDRSPLEVSNFSFDYLIHITYL